MCKTQQLVVDPPKPQGEHMYLVHGASLAQVKHITVSDRNFKHRLHHFQMWSVQCIGGTEQQVA
jgi:hypothetical protein